MPLEAESTQCLCLASGGLNPNPKGPKYLLNKECSRFQKVGIWAWDALGWFPSDLGFGVGGQSYSNFLAPSVSMASVLRLVLMA